MSDKKIILPELRFKGSEESELTLKVNLEQDSRHIVEGDRTVILDQSEQYDRERQESEKYRLTGIIRPIWKNMTDVTVVTGDNPSTDEQKQILQNLFYNNDFIEGIINLTSANTPDNLVLSLMRGKISSNEMDFVRRDFKGSNDENDYTWFNSGNGFGPVFANNINWSLYLTYPFEKITQFEQRGIGVNLQEGNGMTTFNLSSGLPYTVEDMGSYYEFYSPFPHGLSDNEFVSINGEVYTINGLGNKKYRSEENYFIIYKGQFDNTFTTVNGTFKRVLEKNNPEESTSEYYILNHKVLRTPSDFELHRNAFESSIFEDEKEIQKFAVDRNTGIPEYASPGKVITQEMGDTYMFILNDEIDTEDLVDHLDRPITKLYLTTLHNNKMRFFNRQEKGYDNQFGYNTEDALVKDANDLYDNNTDIETKQLQVGDTIEGGIYEYNPYEMVERKVSDRYNRLIYSDTFFRGVYGPNYYYQPHYEYGLRVFSDYIEESETSNIYNLPSYAKYFEKEGVWKWRDIWSKGYVNPNGLGVDYPFINGCHYINKVLNFYIKPDTVDGLTNSRVKDNRINPFTIDDCE